MPQPAQLADAAPDDRAWSAAYYRDKVEVLRRIFGGDTYVTDEHVVVGDRQLPVFEDVIVALPPTQYPDRLRGRNSRDSEGGAATSAYAKDVQDTFGSE